MIPPEQDVRSSDVCEPVIQNHTQSAIRTLTNACVLLFREVNLFIDLPLNTPIVPKHITLWAMKGCFFLELIQLGHLN